MSFSLNSLNEEQYNAVTQTEGAVLVTAGAGSGKTRVLTTRIAHILCELNVKPYEVLAITFTNKAANEMRSRLYEMGAPAKDVWGFTFHGFCLKILRKFIDKLPNYNSNFSIFAEQEREHCIKRIVKELDLDDQEIKNLIYNISRAKSWGIEPFDFKTQYNYIDNVDTVACVYEAYNKELQKQNALDFDDLLIKALYLLKNDEEVRTYYQTKFKYIHVDEFQDTNSVQYEMLKIIAAKNKNIFVVGDEDQSIYSWRGAVINILSDFINTYNPRIYKLEQNYRSTKKYSRLRTR